jgi:WD40 repeat protein
VWVRPVGASGSIVMIPAGGTQIGALAFAPSDRVLALGGFDGRVRIARLEPAVRVTTLAASHQGGIVRLAFSPNGRFLASGAFDRVAIVHEWREGRMYARFEPHEDEVSVLDFIEGGQLLVAGNSVGGRVVWDLARRQRLATLGGSEGPVASVSLSATGRRAAVVHKDETVSLRSWDNAALVRDACSIVGRNLTCAEWRQGFPHQPYRQTCSRAPVPDCEP